MCTCQCDALSCCTLSGQLQEQLLDSLRCGQSALRYSLRSLHKTLIRQIFFVSCSATFLSLFAPWPSKKTSHIPLPPFHLLSISSCRCHHLRIWTIALLLSCRYLSGGSAAPPLGSLQPSLFPVDLTDSFVPSPPPNLSKLINRPQSPRERKASPSSLPSRLSRALSLGTIPSISRTGTFWDSQSPVGESSCWKCEAPPTPTTCPCWWLKKVVIEWVGLIHYQFKHSCLVVFGHHN